MIVDEVERLTHCYNAALQRIELAIHGTTPYPLAERSWHREAARCAAALAVITGLDTWSQRQAFHINRGAL